MTYPQSKKIIDSQAEPMVKEFRHAEVSAGLLFFEGVRATPGAFVV